MSKELSSAGLMRKGEKGKGKCNMNKKINKHLPTIGHGGQWEKETIKRSLNPLITLQKIVVLWVKEQVQEITKFRINKKPK